MNQKKLKFYQLNTRERLHHLRQSNTLDPADWQIFTETLPSGWPDYANQWIENSIGYLHVPLGIIPNVLIDGVYYDIPMAVEETSIIAGVAKMAKWVNQYGGIKTDAGKNLLLGHIPFPKKDQHSNLEKTINDIKDSLIEQVHQNILTGLHRRGGGIHSIQYKETNGFEIVVVQINTCDAMGANLMNQALAFIQSQLEKKLGIKAIMGILSNLQTESLSHAKLSVFHEDQDHLEKIAMAYHFATEDPYRATTHNKGVFNGIDALCVATGNDWRAVEAGGHAYAAHTGRYQPLTSWKIKERYLHGEIKMPLQIGTVGGVTKNHPIAQTNLKIMGNPDACTLRRIMLGIGLLQNLAALHALTGEGIVAGHMRLHIENLLTPFQLKPPHHHLIKNLLIKRVKAGEAITESIIQVLIKENSTHV